MKAKEIKVGCLYTAKVSGKLVTVRVDSIREVTKRRMNNYSGKPVYGEATIYDVTNLSTGRKTTFRSAQKFRIEAKPRQQVEPQHQILRREAKSDRPDPTESASIKSTIQPLANGDRSAQPTSPGLTKGNPDCPICKGSGKMRLSAIIKPRRGLEIIQDDMGDCPCVAIQAKMPSSLSNSLAKALTKKGTGVDMAPHVIVEARAGTGKSTTLLEGVLDVCEMPTHIMPSPQQQAVWDSMRLSRGKVQSIHMVAFNKPIADHLGVKLRDLGLPLWVTASTMHSMGFKAVQRALGRCEPSSYVVQDIIADILERDIRDLRRDKPVVLKAAEQLVSLCKMNLTKPIAGPSGELRWSDALYDLAAIYDVDLNGQSYEVFNLVPAVLERCKDPSRQGGKITFDDMIWLPVVLNLSVQRYDLLLVDEAQDLNRCQQALAKRAGHRLILCGDPKQAIYGFAGADAESMVRLERELSATNRGCVHLPLTVTRRCGKAIVREAQKYVPDFGFFEGNCEGSIGSLSIGNDPKSDYRKAVADGDMVLSRVNAPLVSECFRFLRKGIRANIQGRDVGAGLISTIKKCLKVKEEAELSAYPVAQLMSAVSQWLYNEERKENAKRNPNEARLIALRDRHDCIVCFTEGAQTSADVTRKINSIFTDDKNGTGIRLSSIHRAKGLEARRVFFINTKDSPCPHPMAKTPQAREQELNLCYVGITRAIEELVYVVD